MSLGGRRDTLQKVAGCRHSPEGIGHGLERFGRGWKHGQLPRRLPGIVAERAVNGVEQPDAGAGDAERSLHLERLVAIVPLIGNHRVDSGRCGTRGIREPI